MRLWHHPESDALFVDEPGDWQNSADGALCNDVSDIREMVSRWNVENPGYLLHVWHTYETCDCTHDRCVCCDGGLAFCMVCRAGECELTTDCPGHRTSEARREEVCKGSIDFWSGVWL